MRSGSVMALNTRSRGASNSLVMRISLFEGSVTLVAKLLAVAISFLLVFSFELAKHVVELLESLLPRAAIRLQPVVELLQRLRAQPVDPLLRQRTDLDEPGFAQDAKVLRDLRLPQPEPVSDLPHRARLAAEELDDLAPVRFRESAEDLLHGLIYTLPRIYLSRHIRGEQRRLRACSAVRRWHPCRTAAQRARTIGRMPRRRSGPRPSGQ